MSRRIPLWPALLLIVGAVTAYALVTTGPKIEPITELAQDPITIVAYSRAISVVKDEKQPAVDTSGTAALAFQTVAQNIYKPTIRIWVHGDSIRPSVIRTRPGVVVLRAENDTRSDVSLVVERVLPGEILPVARITTTNGSKRVRRELILEAGEYVYYDAARPQIKGTLIVELPGH